MPILVGTSNSHILRAFKELLPGIKYHKTKTVVVFVIVPTFQYLVNASECMLRLQSFKNVEIPNPFSSIVPSAAAWWLVERQTSFSANTTDYSSVIVVIGDNEQVMGPLTLAAHSSRINQDLFTLKPNWFHGYRGSQILYPNLANQIASQHNW